MLYKWHRMDAEYYDPPLAISEKYGFPPSFYLRFSPDQQNEILNQRKEELTRLKKKLEKFCKENNIHDPDTQRS